MKKESRPLPQTTFQLGFASFQSSYGVNMPTVAASVQRTQRPVHNKKRSGGHASI
jgi:hypothetical protein